MREDGRPAHIRPALPYEPARSDGGFGGSTLTLVYFSWAPAAPFAGQSPSFPCTVIPAKAGIQSFAGVDSRLRGNDRKLRGNDVVGNWLCRANQRAALAGWWFAQQSGDILSLLCHFQYQLHAVAYAELAINRAEVGLDGAFGDVELAGDFFVAAPFHYRQGDGTFTLGEAGEGIGGETLFPSQAREYAAQHFAQQFGGYPDALVGGDQGRLLQQFGGCERVQVATGAGLQRLHGFRFAGGERHDHDNNAVLRQRRGELGPGG